MSTYNFNITKNNDTDLKKDILSKMSEIREKYNSDEEYYNFFYDVVFVLNMIDVNSNITLNIKEDSTYTLIYLSNNESKTITGNLNIIKGVFDLGADLGAGLGDILTPKEDKPHVVDESPPGAGESPPGDGKIIDVIEQQPVEDVKPPLTVHELNTTGNTPPISEKKEKKGFLGLWGGNKNSESDFESDGSIISSDDESEDIIPYMTAVFDDDDDEEDLMDYVKNMKSKKYLKTLNNVDLREILRKNNQVISKNNNYLSKKDMITSITQFYK